MAIEKTVGLNVETTQAQKALNKFGGTLEDVYGEGVQPLNFAIGELEDRLYEMAAAGDTSSKQFQEMADEVASMKKVIIETDITLDGMAQTTTQKVGGALSGLAGGFSLVQGVMGAFGVKSKEINKALLRVQSAMAINEGIQTIKESSASFKGLQSVIAKTAVGQKALSIAQAAGAKVMKVFNKVLGANPIFKLVAIITAVVAAFKYFTSSTESAEEANEKLNATLERQSKALELNASKVRKLAEIRRAELELNGATEEELHQDTLRRLKEEEELRKEQIEQTKKFIKEKSKLINDAFGIEVASKNKEIQAEKDKLEQLELQNKDYYIAVKQEKQRFTKWENSENKNNYKTHQQNRLAALRLIQDLELELNADEIEANNLKYERLIEDTKKDETKKQEEKEKIIASYELLRKQAEDKIIAEREAKEKASAKRIADFKKQAQDQQLDDEAEFYEEYNQNTLTQAQLEEQAITDKYFNLIEKAKQYNLDTTELERKQAEELKAINDRAAKEEIQKERDKQQAKLQMASDALGAISQLVTAFAGENEAAQRKAFNINKAISIGQAVINTAQAVTGALAETSIVPGARFVKAGIAAATGAAQIATISRTQFQSSGGSIDTSSITTPQLSQQAPTFNVVGDNGVNQLASTLGSQPLKAYVVSGDVTTAQSLERNKIEQSKL